METKNVLTAELDQAPESVSKQPSTPLQDLYNSISEGDQEVKDLGFEGFRSQMMDENNLKALYGSLSDDDPEVKDYGFDGFKSDMLGGRPEVKQAASQADPALQPVQKGSFGGELVDQTQSGSESILAAAYGAPGYVYDFVGAGFRGLGVDVPRWKDSWASPVKMGGVDVNPLSRLENSKNDLLQAAKANDQAVRKANPELDRGVFEPLSQGEIGTGMRNLFSSIVQSAPASAAMMASGGLSTAAQVGAGAALFGSQNINQADVEGDYGKVSRDALLAISAVTGSLESIFETTLGSGAVGKSIISLIKEKGEKAAVDEIKKSFGTSMAQMLIKNPWMTPFGEAFEEMGTQLSQNAVNKYTGYQPDIKITDGVLDAGLIGFGMGSVHGGIIEGVKRGLNSSSPAGPSFTGSDSTPIPTIDPRSQAEQAARQYHKDNANPDTGVLKTIQEVTQIWTPNNTHFVVKEWDEPGVEEGTTRHMFGVTMPDGSFRQFEKGPSLIENNDAMSEDDYIKQQLSVFEQKNTPTSTGTQVEPVLKSQIEEETAPAYSHDGIEIPKEDATKIVKLAIKLKDKTELEGFSYSNDPEIDALIEKAWPKPPVSIKIKGIKVDREDALTRIKYAKTIDKLNELMMDNIDSDPELQQAFSEKVKKLTSAKFSLNENLITQKQALTHIKFSDDLMELQELKHENIESNPEVQAAYEAKIMEFTPAQNEGGSNNPEKMTGIDNHPTQAKFTLFGDVVTPQQALMHIKFANDLNDLNELGFENIDSDPKVKEAYDAMLRELTPSQIRVQSSEKVPGRMEPVQEPSPVAAVETSVAPDLSITGKQQEPGKNRIVTDERYQELKRRMKEKLNNLNSGFDPELFAIGAEMAAYHIESGVRKFADFSRQMVADLGDNIKPHLKSLYNDARNLSGMEPHITSMDSPETVKLADIEKLLSQGNSSINTQAATAPAGGGAVKNKTATKGAVLGDSSNSTPSNAPSFNQETKISGESFEAGNQAAGKVPPKSINPKVEESMKSAHGIKGEPFMEKFKRWGQELKETAQHFKHITESEFPSVYNKLRLFEAIPDKVKKEALENISRVVNPIVKDKALFEAFERHIVLQDLLGDVRKGMFEGKELPWGYNSENEIQQDADRMAEFVNSNPLLAKVLNDRKTMMNQVRDQLIESGILSPKTKGNDNYFHHQVLEYMEARQRQDIGVSSRDAKLHHKGWQQSRVGSMKAYNTAYLESEFEVLAQSLEKLEIKKMLNKIGAETNIMNTLVEKSNAENYNVAQFNLKVTNAKDKRKYTSWRDFISEGYKPWFPKAGSNAYKAATFAERAAQNMMINADREVAENIEELIAEADLSMWVIPGKIANQLDAMRTPEKEIIPVRLMRKFNNWWKQWILINPFRVMKYNLNNMSGDLDIVLAYNPEILKPEYAHTAMKELWNDLKGKGMSNDIKEALEQGVITSGLSIQEIPDISKEGVFKSLTGDDNLILKYWGASKDYTSFRENLLRIAAFKFFKDQLNKGKSVYGVSEKKSIDALSDVNEKAGKLARELIGDYGNLSQGGQWLRSHVYPFWSWVEINTPRYYRLLKNTAHEGHSTAGTGARVAGVAAKKTATNVLTTSAKMLLFAGLVSLWNWTFFDDEDEELSKTGNRQLRLILGRREDGTIMTIRISGAFADMLSFVGLEDSPQDFRDLKAGDTTIGKKVKEAGNAFANKIAQGMMPIEKTGAEVAIGNSLYPDVFNPRPIRDKAEHALKTFSMDRIYRFLTKKPLRSMDKEVTGLIVYDTDPGEAAYYTVRQKIYDFMKEEGIENTSGEPTDRSNALFYYKQSLKLKNQELAEHWFQEYINEGGTKQGYKSSLKSGVVTSPLPRQLQEKWWNTLDQEDKELVGVANDWYDKTYLNSEPPEPGQR